MSARAEWVPRSEPDAGRDQCLCHCYHCRPVGAAELKCNTCGFMPAAEPQQLLTDATVLLATARLAGATCQDLAAVQEDAIWFADTAAIPAPPMSPRKVGTDGVVTHVEGGDSAQDACPSRHVGADGEPR